MDQHSEYQEKIIDIPENGMPTGFGMDLVFRHREELSGRVRKHTDEIAGMIRTALAKVGCNSLSEMSEKFQSHQVPLETVRTILAQAAVLEQKLGMEDIDWDSFDLLETKTVRRDPDFLIDKIKTLPDGQLALTRRKPGDKTHRIQSVITPDTGTVIAETGGFGSLLGVSGTKIIGYKTILTNLKSVVSYAVWDYGTGGTIDPFERVFPLEKENPAFLDHHRLYLTTTDKDRKIVTLYSYDLSDSRTDRVDIPAAGSGVQFPFTVRCLTPSGNLVLQEMDPERSYMAGNDYVIWDPKRQMVIQRVQNIVGGRLKKISDTKTVISSVSKRVFAVWDLRDGTVQDHRSPDWQVTQCLAYPDPVSGFVLAGRRVSDFILFDPRTDSILKKLDPPAEVGTGSTGPNTALDISAGGCVYIGLNNRVFKYGPAVR